ncbi:MAG: SpoIIE family protein phosphatase [Leptospiraceae bacterium]|nr:SpoIIE family protein phosphatase [Leptospiraceae bacterium]MCP5501490.1 SpoIIE family protein phosphatase [Leptospiraceae bacterium]
MNVRQEVLYRDFTILVVDDDINMTLFLKRTLEKRGYRVFTTSNANEARILLSSEKIDILLLDVNIPGESGYSLCQSLRTNPEFELLPIIFITTVDKTSGLEEAVSYGGDDYISKPVNTRELLAKVRSYCRIKALQDLFLKQKQDYERELATARKVQVQMIPEKEFQWHGCNIRTFFKPVIEIGGDYVDVWETGGKLHIVIADSIGHGPSGALLGAMFKMQLYSLGKELPLKERVELLRKNLIKAIPENYSITFFYGILSDDLKFSYINGGNPPPLLYANGSVSELPGKSPLIIDLDIPQKTEVKEIQLQKDSILFLYTDGVSEATSPDMKMLGTGGLKKLIPKCVKEGDIIDNIMLEVKKFCGLYAPHDDIAMIRVQL